MELVVGIYLYLLPFMLFAAWAALAFWDLARRDDLGRTAALGWIAGILLVPMLGVIAYHAIGGSEIPTWLRAGAVGGGTVVYLLVLLVAAGIA